MNTENTKPTKSTWIHHPKRDGSEWTQKEILAYESFLNPIHKEVMEELRAEFREEKRREEEDGRLTEQRKHGSKEVD